MLQERLTPFEIVRIAKEHGGQYLLPRRLKIGVDTVLDAKYESAEWLVANRYAEWLPAGSSKWPGITLSILDLCYPVKRVSIGSTNSTRA